MGIAAEADLEPRRADAKYANDGFLGEMKP